MPYMTCQRVLGGNAETTQPRVQRALGPARGASRLSRLPRTSGRRELRRSLAFPRGATWPPIRRLEPRRCRCARSCSNPRRCPRPTIPRTAPARRPARRADPRRSRRSAVQSANYQEKHSPRLPRRVKSTDLADGCNPALEPASHGRRSHGLRRPDGLGGPDGLRRTRWSATATPAAIRATKVLVTPAATIVVDEPCWGPRRPLFCIGPDGHLGEGRLLAVVGERHPRAGLGHHGAFDHHGALHRAESGQTRRAWHPGAFRRRLHQRQIGERRPHPGWNVAQSLRDHRFRGRVLRPGRREHQLLPSGPERTATRSLPGRSSTSTLPAPGRAGRVGRLSPRQRRTVVDGAININASTRFHGAGRTSSSPPAARKAAGPTTAVLHDLPRPLPRGLRRRLSVPGPGGPTRHHGNLTSTAPPPITADNPECLSAFLVHDQFNTQNSFNGGDLGMKFEFQRNRWSLDMFPRIALGSTHSTVDINGSTRITTDVAAGARRWIDDHRRSAGPIRHEHRPLRAGQLRRRARTRFETRLPVHSPHATGRRLRLSCTGATWPGRASRSIRTSTRAYLPTRRRYPDDGAGTASVHLPEHRILGPGHQCRRGLPMVMNLRPLSSRWV